MHSISYQYTNSKGTTYHLHKKDVRLKGSGKEQTIYFFAKEAKMGVLDALPEGYKVVESERTGLPILKRF